MKKVFLILVLLYTISYSSQENSGNWSVSLNIASTLYLPKDDATVLRGGNIIYQFPRITLSKYIGNNLTVTGAFSSDFGLDDQKYTSFDLYGNYEIFKIFKKINVYALAGASLVSRQDVTPLLNLGGGGTLWLSKSIGLNSELFYKFNLGSSDTERSHFFSSVGIVYSFNSDRSSRIWNKDH